MTALKMMLRVFTTIFGATHPRPEEEARYAWLLFGTAVFFVVIAAAAVWVAAHTMW